MFTGIIEDVGKVYSINSIKSGIRLTVGSQLTDELKLGDSVAINGACLTVTEKNKNTFGVDVSFETLNRTNIGSLSSGSMVNLERALKLSNRLDGHIVLGHVDTTTRIISLNKIGDFYVLSIATDAYIFNHSVEKGSIAVDGISLTIAELNNSSLSIAVIPFTYENTNLKYKKPGDKLNIEVDIIGKYVEKFTKKSNGLTEEFLKLHGFA